MGRYSQLYHAAAFNQVAGQSYLGQASLSFARYSKYSVEERPLELGLTWDSGLFIDPRGHALYEFLGTAALRFAYGVFETWNDAVNFKDTGPTYGARLMFDVLRMFGR